MKLFEDIKENPKFPKTRYQGSKQKLIEWIKIVLDEANLEYETVLDAFGGTGVVSYMFKELGKEVTYNDALKFNSIIAEALIENNEVKLEENDLNFILTKDKNIQYPSLIYDNFEDFYFTTEENKWLDTVVTNIGRIENKYKKALAYFALFQASIIKRPYNLFHRKNLYVRTAEVKRSFGNKATWDKPFEEHFRNFVEEGNKAIFDNGKNNISTNQNISNVEGNYDLVYIDPPYISSKGTGADYLDYYHFLEGYVNYENWENEIDHNYKHKRLKKKEHIKAWTSKKEITSLFDQLFKKYKDSILVVSYREDGIPTVDELITIMKKYKNEIVEVKAMKYQYALSTKKTSEILLIGK